MVKAYQCGPWFHVSVGILMDTHYCCSYVQWFLNVVVKLIFSYGSCLIFLLECLSPFLAISLTALSCMSLHDNNLHVQMEEIVHGMGSLCKIRAKAGLLWSLLTEFSAIYSLGKEENRLGQTEVTVR